MRPCKQMELKEQLVRPCKMKEPKELHKNRLPMEQLMRPCKKKEPKEPTVREGLEL